MKWESKKFWNKFFLTDKKGTVEIMENQYLIFSWKPFQHFYIENEYYGYIVYLQIFTKSLEHHQKICQIATLYLTYVCLVSTEFIEDTIIFYESEKNSSNEIFPHHNHSWKI